MCSALEIRLQLINIDIQKNSITKIKFPFNLSKLDKKRFLKNTIANINGEFF